MLSLWSWNADSFKNASLQARHFLLGHNISNKGQVFIRPSFNIGSTERQNKKIVIFRQKSEKNTYLFYSAFRDKISV